MRTMSMRKILVATLTAVAAMCWSVPLAHAVPIQLTQAQFTAATAGVTTVTEDFEGFPAGAESNPFTFANGSYTDQGGTPEVFSDPTFCGTANDHCLIATNANTDRVFSAFPSGTTLWAVTDFFTIQPLDVFQVTAIGNGGTSVFNVTGVSFFSVLDPSGLLSVTFHDLGAGGGLIGNYSFDNIVTASAQLPPAVPEPGTLSLIGLGLAVGVRRWRRRDSSTR